MAEGSHLMESVRQFYAEKRGSLPTTKEAAHYFVDELEELTEIQEAGWSIENVGHFAKEAADVVFTLAGLCAARGIDLDEAFRLVCESNMTKQYTPEGKVQKGPGYREPDMSSALTWN